jgi:hypothetical protein
MNTFVTIKFGEERFDLSRTDATFLAEQLAAAVRSPGLCMSVSSVGKGGSSAVALERTHAMCHPAGDRHTDC